jgi:choline dehydrogenase-like flavoprotein
MDLQEFDYVIVGGGSAGCALAGRLSEDPGTTVCVLEAGGADSSVFVRAPLGIIVMVPWGLMNSWHYFTTPQKGFAGRKGFQPRGKVLGGSSSINAMVYTRCNRNDYDGWAAAGNPGWSYAGPAATVQACGKQPLLRRQRVPRQQWPAACELPAQPLAGQRGLPFRLRRERHSAQP